MTYTFDFERYN